LCLSAMQQPHQEIGETLIYPGGVDKEKAECQLVTMT
jgi:hypothetical protein